MTNVDDEGLQNAIEKGAIPEHGGADANAYRELFRVLKNKGDTRLSEGFAERVVQELVRRQKQAELRDYFWYALGVLVLAMAGTGTILYTGFQLDLRFLNALADYKGLVLFAVGLIMVLNWLDRRFIRGYLARTTVTKNAAK